MRTRRPSPAERLLRRVIMRELGPPYTETDLLPLPRAEARRLARRYSESMQRLLQLVRDGLRAHARPP